MFLAGGKAHRVCRGVRLQAMSLAEGRHTECAGVSGCSGRGVRRQPQQHLDAVAGVPGSSRIRVWLQASLCLVCRAVVSGSEGVRVLLTPDFLPCVLAESCAHKHVHAHTHARAHTRTSTTHPEHTRTLWDMTGGSSSHVYPQRIRCRHSSPKGIGTKRMLDWAGTRELVSAYQEALLKCKLLALSMGAAVGAAT